MKYKELSGGSATGAWTERYSESDIGMTGYTDDTGTQTVFPIPPKGYKYPVYITATLKNGGTIYTMEMKF